LLQTLAISGRGAELLTVVAALAAAFVVNVFLIGLALQPVKDLEDVARLVSDGDFNTRALPSPFADRDLARLGTTINQLLDSLAAERSRIRDLGVQVVHANDVERANVSHELHDSIAQTLAAVRLQLSAARRASQDAEVISRIEAASELIAAAMDDVVNVSHVLHSRVAEDLGIEAGLRALARQVRDRSGIDIDICFDIKTPIPALASATLYRVAEEGLRNAEIRPDVSTVTVSLFAGEGAVNIEITDDGGMGNQVSLTPGLIAIKHRVLLAGGKMTIDTAAAGGTSVKAEIRTMRAAS
jgi:signal transduction histidine kinase